ncbi:unnamed protein product [Caenorhabditis bovis]|nr:unnamed protein product [Caenorhabditis bovis]
MIHWSESEINSLLSKVEYLYYVKIYIESTMAVKIDFSSLREIDGVLLEIKYGSKLRTIDFRRDGLTVKKSELYAFALPLLNDENLALLKRYCGDGDCEHARETKINMWRRKDKKNGLEWCWFHSPGVHKATFYKPHPYLTSCKRIFNAKIYMVGWPVAEIEKVLKNIEAGSFLVVFIARTDVEVLDVTSTVYVDAYHFYMLDNPKLKDVYFSDVIRNTEKFRSGFTVLSFNNPKMSYKSNEYLKLFCDYACLMEDVNLKPTPPTTTPKIPTQQPLIVATEPMPSKEMMIPNLQWMIGQEDQSIPVTEVHEESVETTTESIDEHSHATSSSILLIPAILLVILLGDF